MAMCGNNWPAYLFPQGLFATRLLHADLHQAIMRHDMFTQNTAMCSLRLVIGTQQKATLFVDKNLLLNGGFPFSHDFSS